MNASVVGEGRAHAKSILCGEHAVVYGAPAVAIPMRQVPVTVWARRSGEPGGQVSLVNVAPGQANTADRRADEAPAAARLWDRSREADSGLHDLVAAFFRTTGITACGIDLSVDCAIPPGRGMGSSAACGRAVVLALASLFGRIVDADTVFDLVQTAERVAHGSPSGVDTVATGSPVPIWFQSGVTKELSVGLDGVFVIADSGVPGETKAAVDMLRARFEADPASRTRFLRRSSVITASAVEDLTLGRAGDLGRRLTENHELLSEFGLSTAELDRLLAAALDAGCLGGKLSGGGLGGCVVVLADSPEHAERATAALRTAGATATWSVPTGRFAN